VVVSALYFGTFAMRYVRASRRAVKSLDAAKA
jgi:hypothetical protein